MFVQSDLVGTADQASDKDERDDPTFEAYRWKRQLGGNIGEIRARVASLVELDVHLLPKRLPTSFGGILQRPLTRFRLSVNTGFAEDRLVDRAIGAVTYDAKRIGSLVGQQRINEEPTSFGALTG